MIIKKRSFLFLLILITPLTLSAAKSKVVTKDLPLKKTVSVEKAETKAEGKAKAESEPDNDKIDDYLSSLERKMIDTEESEPVAIETPKAKAVPESEIPVVIGKAKEKEAQVMTSFQKMLGAIATICLFGMVCMFFIFRKGKVGALNSGSRNIKILARKPLGPKRELMVIQVAGESILLGVTDHSVNFLKGLAILDDEMPQIAPDNFSKQLQRNIDVDFTAPEAESVDGYTVSKLSDVKDIVTKRFVI